MRRLLTTLLFALCAGAADRRIALTIDDLPIAQSGSEACEPGRMMELTEQLLSVFRAEQAPLTAFVITSQCPSLTEEQRRAAIDRWRQAGVEIGNHTHSHQSLSRTPVGHYEKDIMKADALLRRWAGGEPVRFFRWPLLHTGTTPEIKQRLEAFLVRHGYRTAPVTFDNSDWIFAGLFARARRRGDHELADKLRKAYVPYMESVLAFFERRSVELLDREIPQILLMHANLLNAEAGGELLSMLRERGYAFISLEEALADPAYSAPDSYVAANGISWLHRWTVTQGGEIEWEPEVPDWVLQLYRQRR